MREKEYREETGWITPPGRTCSATRELREGTGRLKNPGQALEPL